MKNSHAPLILYLAFILLSACSTSLPKKNSVPLTEKTGKTLSSGAERKIGSTSQNENKSQVMPTIQPKKPLGATLFPGHVHLIEYPEPDFIELNNYKLICKGNQIPYFYESGQIKAIVIQDYFSKLESFECRAEFTPFPGKVVTQVVVQIDVSPYNFVSERIRVNKKRVFLSLKDKKRVRKERKLLAQLYKKVSKGILLAQGQFIAPLKSKITSYYGSKRVFNNQKKSYHLGIDFRAKVGVPIRATNSGMVIFAGNLFYTGNTVIVAHGQDIYSLYGHLSKLLIDADRLIQKGTIVGLSGMTGRVSGPHLHWGIKVQGSWVNGFSLMEVNL